ETAEAGSERGQIPSDQRSRHPEREHHADRAGLGDQDRARGAHHASAAVSFDPAERAPAVWSSRLVALQHVGLDPPNFLVASQHASQPTELQATGRARDTPLHADARSAVTKGVVSHHPSVGGLEEFRALTARETA
ncbi:MAG TPA: hypothetical protein VGQ98_00065, partial [Gemmatimonadaceae bacterium]|nr:hypothetical protein [Gemmatimonadaceae bacterium]